MNPGAVYLSGFFLIVLAAYVCGATFDHPVTGMVVALLLAVSLMGLTTQVAARVEVDEKK